MWLSGQTIAVRPRTGVSLLAVIPPHQSKTNYLCEIDCATYQIGVVVAVTRWGWQGKGCTLVAATRVQALLGPELVLSRGPQFGTHCLTALSRRVACSAMWRL